MACAAPHSPMRIPSRFCCPALANTIMAPIAATAKPPLAVPSRKTLASKDQFGLVSPPQHSRNRATAESRQPPLIQNLSNTAPLDLKRRVEIAIAAMPSSTPPCCTPASWVDSPGVRPKTSPAKGSRIKS